MEIKKKSKRKKKEKGKEKEIRKVKKKRKKEDKRGRERNSIFSLRSTEIGPLVFVGARDKIHLCDKSYAWVPNLRFL